MSSCIFCKIVTKEIPADIVYEDERVIAFKDIHPQAPIHVLIIPKKHIPGVMDITPEDTVFCSNVGLVARQIAQKEGIDQSGFRLVINNGPNAGQAVAHLHWHLLGGRKMGWPPG
ncbi:MAG TPA: histidine triad nucleotide-binding protein [Elusimicrobiota bacterium]|nr:histidine triad nucleotide-binding protein [Elusimicrobiota bacterium]